MPKSAQQKNRMTVQHWEITKQTEAAFTQTDFHPCRFTIRE
jgi:hypothetical protein